MTDPRLDPTELGEVKQRAPAVPVTPQQRLAALASMTTEEVMAVAYRVARCEDPLRAATNLSQREIIGMAEALVTTEEALRRRLLRETPPGADAATAARPDAGPFEEDI